MKDFGADDFARHHRRVRSPVSQRRTRRLVRFSLVCATAIALALALLVMSLGGSI